LIALLQSLLAGFAALFLVVAQLLLTDPPPHHLFAADVPRGAVASATPTPTPDCKTLTAFTYILSLPEVIKADAPSPTPEPTQKPPQSLFIPILMYHHIGELPPGADAVRRDLTVSAASFEAQMGLLSQEGYETISLDDLFAAFEGIRQLPPKPIILTFDDGYKDNFEYAYPILKKYGFTGTFFIITSLVGSSDYLKWEEAADMAKGGMAIEAHGHTHDDLTLLSYEGVVQQVVEATTAIRSHLNIVSRFYCYPSGKSNQAVVEILRERGYLAAVSTRYGCLQHREDLFQLHRVRIRGSDDLSTFARKLKCEGPN